MFTLFNVTLTKLSISTVHLLFTYYTEKNVLHFKSRSLLLLVCT